MGGLAGRLFLTGQEVEAKWEVLPVSPIAVGGPLLKDLLRAEAHSIQVLHLGVRLEGVSFSGGFPLGHSLGLFRRMDMIVLQPPCILLTVAVSLWPSVFLLHFALVCSGFHPNP
jgi:hypothetical protein